jgi:hypothetical protein
MNKERIPEKVLNAGGKRKTAKSETEIEMRTAGWEESHTKERKIKGRN